MELPFEVGVLCWVSTIVFWVAVVVIVAGIVKMLKKNNPPIYRRREGIPYSNSIGGSLFY
jgi:hypothetical protein